MCNVIKTQTGIIIIRWQWIINWCQLRTQFLLHLLWWRRRDVIKSQPNLVVVIRW